jgi:hypothetical protein
MMLTISASPAVVAMHRLACELSRTFPRAADTGAAVESDNGMMMDSGRL